MSVQLNLDIDVLGREIESDLESAAIETLKGVAQDIEPYVPYRTGELNDSVVLDESSLSLEWEAEHAEYVYDMPKSANFDKSVHPQATSQWVEEGLKAYQNKWVEDLRRNFSRR